MIPAPPGLVARYEHTVGERTHYTSKPVVAFDSNGRALVAQQGKTALLIPADHYNNFHDISTEETIVSLIPAGGWHIEWTADDGTKTSAPLVAWVLRANGDVVPVDTDTYGSTFALDDHNGDKFRIYHPDETRHEETSPRTNAAESLS